MMDIFLLQTNPVPNYKPTHAGTQVDNTSKLPPIQLPSIPAGPSSHPETSGTFGVKSISLDSTLPKHDVSRFTSSCCETSVELGPQTMKQFVTSFMV